MKKWSPIFIFILICSCKNTKDEKFSKSIEQTVDSIVELSFPIDFLGVYKGELEITSSNGIENIPMEFHLLKTNDSLKYDYKIFYGEEKSERAYKLILTENPNVYELDENNGIILPIAYSNYTLFSTYEVAGNLINNSEVFYEDRMDFMITMSSLETKEKSGEAEGYQVTSYPILVIQQATLFKVEN